MYLQAALFNSWTFIVGFMLLALIGYWLLRPFQCHRGAVLFLALTSYGFYAVGEPHYPLLLALSIAVNLVLGRRLATMRTGAARRAMFFAAISINPAALAVFKYSNFVTTNLPASLGIAVTNLALPVGISFFTITQIAYLVDVYQRSAKDFDPARYALFVTFFPHLIAGSSLHHGEMMPQFRDDERPRLYRHLCAGTAIFVIRLAKKVLIADSLAATASGVFDHAATGATISFATACRGWSALRSRLGLPALPPTVGWTLTMLAVIVAWIPFRASDLATTLAIWQAMFQAMFAPLLPAMLASETLGSMAAALLTLDPALHDVLGRKMMLLLALALLIARVAPNSQQIMHRYRIGLDSPGYNALARWRLPMRERVLTVSQPARKLSQKPRALVSGRGSWANPIGTNGVRVRPVSCCWVCPLVWRYG